jgi:hypothetical protein
MCIPKSKQGLPASNATLGILIFILIKKSAKTCIADFTIELETFEPAKGVCVCVFKRWA